LVSPGAIVLAGVEQAKRIVVEVNPNMPRSHGTVQVFFPRSRWPHRMVGGAGGVVHGDAAAGLRRFFEFWLKIFGVAFGLGASPAFLD
jgi:hypothetical protein